MQVEVATRAAVAEEVSTHPAKVDSKDLLTARLMGTLNGLRVVAGDEVVVVAAVAEVGVGGNSKSYACALYLVAHIS